MKTNWIASMNLLRTYVVRILHPEVVSRIQNGHALDTSRRCFPPVSMFFSFFRAQLDSGYVLDQIGCSPDQYTAQQG